MHKHVFNFLNTNNVIPSLQIGFVPGDSTVNLLVDFNKVRKVAKIRNRYKQVPHLSHDITWENDKNTIKVIDESQEASSFPARLQ